jgi:predicted Zn finger-like uncharacterized protein
MILTCPSCSTRYFADDASLGRKAKLVRCAACGHAWRAKRERPGGGGLPARLAGAAKAVAAGIAGRSLAPGAPNMRMALVTWGAAGAGVLALMALAVAFRFEVVDAWPGAASVYAAAGFAAEGLAFESVTAAPGYERGAPTLTVAAVVRNTTRRARAVPPVEISLHDERGRELFAWTVALTLDELGPREAARFTAKLAQPPADAEDVELTFLHGDAADAVPAAAEVLE